MRVCVRRWVGVPLVVGLLGVAGCAAPATRYPADLKPCDLLSQQAAEELLGVGTLDPPEAKDGWLGEYTVNEYCTWSWERPEDWQAGAGVGPSERTLTIDLSVYDADSDGADGAAKSMADRHHDGQRPVREIGEEAIWWPARHSWAA
ncbi:MAG: hypothetical protein ACRDT4_17175, partial [Micromonosporaceae bacterium]